MPRKGQISKRERLPDPKYNDVLVQRFVNSVMWDGKKSLAQRLVYGAFDLMEKRLKEDALKVFQKAMDNVKPELEVKARRVGGATYQVPVEVRVEQKDVPRHTVDTALCQGALGEDDDREACR